MKKEIRVINILSLLFAIFVIAVVTFYVINFHDSSISKDPAQWGMLGDYFGGVLNPLISIMTLIFLVKNYLIQKFEIQKMEESAQNQLNISNKTANINLLQTKISTCNEFIRSYLHELDRVNLATEQGRMFTTMEGEEFLSAPQKRMYKLNLTMKIRNEQEKIEQYLIELDA